jgi:hypothetical protein
VRPAAAALGRLRFETDPNCFERSARFVGATELIDPDHVYRLATISTPRRRMRKLRRHLLLAVRTHAGSVRIHGSL